MSKYDFVTGAGHFDNEPYSLMEKIEEQRQAEQMFLNKLAMMLNDFLITKRDPNQSTETELSNGGDINK